MRLHLLRHAEAEDLKPGISDKERELTPAGVEAAEKLAGKLKGKLNNVTCIATSPLPRAAQTAAIFASALNKEACLREDPKLATGADARGLVTHLMNYEGEPCILWVGHEPWLSELVSLLIADTGAGRVRMKKLGLATIEIPVPGHGVLVRLR